MEHLKLALLTAGFSQSLLVAAMLVSFARSSAEPRFYLGVFVGLYGSTFLAEIIAMTGILGAVPGLAVPLMIAPMFLGPLLYLYIIKVVNRDGQLAAPINRQHFIAPSIGAFVASGLLLVPSEAFGRFITEDVGPTAPIDLLVMLMLVVVLLTTFIITLVYIIKGYALLNKNSASIRDEFSNLDRKRLRWLKFSLVNIALLWVAAMAADWTDISDTPAGFITLIVWELASFYVIAVLGLRQGVIFGPQTTPPAPVSPTPPGDRLGALELVETPLDIRHEAEQKYTKSGLTQEDMDRIAAKIRQAVHVDAIYRNSDLSLTQLSKFIGVQAPYVSQTLTQKIGSTFYDFIAQARVRAAMDMLADPDNADSVLSIALTVGFNTKSTFNAAFKRVSGSTPTEWRRSHGANRNSAAG
uniref:helix-turn-helix domain-containing protein n=1 Tax=Maricaulis sp. TaxID=1486257 RepID=UPI002B27ADE3|nr:helix-turn-helix domain-containing protein [Maricaulis sp.]